ncbi:THAP domain-containing protein 9 [Trachymyrmex cornetzi]|uniref:THAP domain-containing protein 9 n=1 Tax=Trachymyrmex cornetzi TaxID=471704 RepID=A0A151IT23_9HYME|nr:THAP domain-containing protein 9 [Trachymyrmex cornetzi]
MKNVETNRQRSKLSNRAVEAIVIMVVCLNENWKIPVAYHFINGLNGEDRANIILECLEKLHPTGINVISLTFDGGSSNIKMAENLRAKFCYTTNFDLSQDHLELFFSSVRSRGGNNNNPTTEQFQSALKWLLIYAQVGSSVYANCIKKHDTCILQIKKSVTKEKNLIVTVAKDISFEEQQSTNDMLNESAIKNYAYAVLLDHNYATPAVFHNVNQIYVKDVIAYKAGFVIKKISKSIKCVSCRKLLTNYETLSSLRQIKNRGKLTPASADVIEICLIAERTLREIQIFETENVKNVLIEKTMVSDTLINDTEFSPIINDIYKRRKGARKKYSAQLRAFALTLNFYSAKAYRYVRKTFCNFLPDPATIRKWYATLDGQPDFTKEALDAVKCKVQKSENPIFCNLVLDEMSIKEKPSYDGNKFQGFVDVGLSVGDSAVLVTAKHALVFMLVALNDHWKLPIGYFLIDSLNGKERMLYDFRLPLKQRGRKQKDDLWNEVSIYLKGSYTPSEAEKRWNYLKDCYRKARNLFKKRQVVQRSGSAGTSKSQLIMPSFRHYDSMTFLNDTLEHRQ